MSIEPKNIIKREYKSIEEKHKEMTNLLKWGEYVDVLYSFVGIITLGLYIKNKSKYIIWHNGKIGYKNPPSNRKVQQLGTIENLNRLLEKEDEDLMELLNTDEIKEFANVYDSIGNLMPIWPGGNEFKGKALINGAYAYDIPNVFFKEHGTMQKVYLENVLKISVEEAALENFLKDNSPILFDIKKY